MTMTISMIADAAGYHYAWAAFRAILPVALGAFIAGLGIAWILWGHGARKGGE